MDDLFGIFEARSKEVVLGGEKAVEEQFQIEFEEEKGGDEQEGGEQ